MHMYFQIKYFPTLAPTIGTLFHFCLLNLAAHSPSSFYLKSVNQFATVDCFLLLVQEKDILANIFLCLLSLDISHLTNTCYLVSYISCVYVYIIRKIRYYLGTYRSLHLFSE